MNKVFKVIWNHATQSWVAVSELTSAKGKTKSKTSKLTALSLAVGSALIGGDALAACATVPVIVTGSDSNNNLAITPNGGSYTATTGTATSGSEPKNIIYIGTGTPAGLADEYVIVGNNITGSSSGNAGDTLIGNRVRSGGGGADSFATAVGYAAQSSGPSVSLGVGSSSDIGDDGGWNATSNGGVAIGGFARVSGGAGTNGGVAVGAGAFADQAQGGSVAIGRLSGAAHLLYDREVAGGGGGGVTRRINEEMASAAANLVSVGNKAGARALNGIAIGNEALTSVFAANATAIGTNASANQQGTIAIGNGAIAGGHNTSNIATLTTQLASLTAMQTAQQTRLNEKIAAMQADTTAENKFQVASARASLERINLAIERVNKDLNRLSAEGNVAPTNAIAIGNQSAATNANSTALGYNTKVSGQNSTVIGSSNNVTANRTMALGNNISELNSSHAGGVILGDNSTGADNVTSINSASVNNITYSGFAGNLGGTTTDGTVPALIEAQQGRFVSVGNSSSPRQVKFVAAGRIANDSTDAINGSQLYLLTSVVGNVGQSVANVIGGNATMDANGTVANFTQPLNVTGLATNQDYTAPADADNIADAITNLNNYVNAGWKIAEGDDTAAKARISPNEQVNFKAAGLATVSVAANGTGANVTYTVTKGEFNTTTNGTAEANATTTGAVTNADVATAINNSGWLTNVTDANGNVTTKVVTPGTQVNYVNGNGTTANVVANDTTGGYDVTFNVSQNGANLTATNSTGKATLSDAANGTSTFLNAQDTVNLINNASFNVTTAKNDVFVTNQEGKANVSVKAGGNITYTAGKNIAIKQDGSNFTFATEQNVTFTNANVTNTLAIGNASSTSSPVVNLKTENATTASVNNNTTTAPTSALNITSADGKATQIKGVASSLNTTTVTTFPSGTTNPSDATTGSTSNLLNLGNETNPLSESVLNSVVTVRDLTNFGWVVSANGNNYTDTVKNANEVKFNGVNGITVTGNTSGDVRNINISLNTTNITSNTNGTASVTNGSSYVNASTVADAINNAGWKTTAVNATTNATETVTVNPGDTVNYVNSSTATANVTVSKGTDGKDVVNVTYDVNTGSITSADSNATITITNADGSTSTIDNPDRGKVTVEEGQGDKVATVQNVADAINSAKWIASVEETGEAITTSTENDTGVAIGAGDELSFKAGKNLKIKRDGQEITYALANDINVTTVTATGNITVGTGDNATTINQGSITNLNDHLTAPTNATSSVANATATTMPSNVSTIGNQAATVNDVLNAGWNLQANNNAVDAVTHGNTVNFVSTDGSVTITPTTDGSTSKLDFAVNATSIVNQVKGTIGYNNGTATTTGDGSRVATVDEVKDAINNTGWTVTDQYGATHLVTPLQPVVRYVNGNGTTAKVDVVDNNGTPEVNISYSVAQNKAGTQNANGTVTIADTANGTSTFLNAQDTVNLINSASFNVTTAKVDSFVTNQEGKENKAVKAGETITYTAGKNIAIKQDGANFTFATEQNVTFTNANVTGTLSVGAGNTTSPVVNITTGTGEHNNNGTTTSPSTVNMGNAQLTNVSAGANVYGANVDENGKPLTAVTVRNAAGQDEIKYYTADQFEANGALKSGATASTPVAANNVSKAVNGLADLASSNATNVMTVADAKNLGWVVSTSDNDYADKVQNANRVDFKGEAGTGVTVKGSTNATTGARELVVGNDYFKANATAGSTAANAAGSNSVAVGPNSVANTAGSVAIGNGANVTTSAPAGSVAIGQGATAGAVNTGAYRIDGSTDVAGAPNASTRVFSVGNASSPAQIQNVAAGVVSATSTDAVNGSQLHATNQAVVNNARAIGNLNNKIDQVDKRGRKGTAIAGAIGMLPQPHISGKSMVSAATTNYRGEQAVAVGYSRLSDNGKHIIKLSGSSNVSGKKDAMVGASYGYQW